MLSLVSVFPLISQESAESLVVFLVLRINCCCILFRTQRRDYMGRQNSELRQRFHLTLQLSPQFVQAQSAVSFDTPCRHKLGGIGSSRDKFKL